MLRATWEARTPAQYVAYTAETVQHYPRILEEPDLEYYDRQKLEMLVGELERRLGLFERARSRFLRIKPDSPGPLRRVTFELQLIEMRNSAPQYLPWRAEPTRRSPGPRPKTASAGCRLGLCSRL
jgi:hypothetical protein